MDRIIYITEAWKVVPRGTMKDTHTKRVKIKKSLLQNTLIEAKQLEQKEVFIAQKEALLRHLSVHGTSKQFLAALQRSGTRVAETEGLFIAALVRARQRLKKRDPSFNLPSLNGLSSLNQVTRALQLLGWSQVRISDFTKDLQEIDAIQNFVAIRKEYESVVKLVEKLIVQLTEAPKDFAKANRQALRLLRKALRSRPYHLLKLDESHHLVHFLHTLALALFVEPKIGTAFQYLGEKLSNLLPSSDAPFHEVLRESSEVASQHGLIKNDRSLRYLFLHYKQLTGAFLSVNIGGRIGRLLGIEYDPRGLFNNTGGHFFDNIVATAKRSVYIRNIFTPSPTIGNQIAPEFYALLQALENRNFFSKDALEQDPYPYLVFAYTNLQDITSIDENRRCVKLMELNQQYPFSFRGITLSVDSPFYTAGIKHKEHRDPQPLDATYAKKQIDQLTKEANFTLQDRCFHKGGGYYFPQIFEDSNFWKMECHKIAHAAFEFLIKKKKPQEIEQEAWNWSIKAVYRELVLLSLVTLFQNRVCREREKKKGECLLHVLVKKI